MDSERAALGVDVGGTFTDVVLIADGTVTTAKVPTSDEQSEGVLRGIEVACEEADVAPESVTQFRHAMTVATNAMLEGNGAQTALVTTDGFADVIEIGRQDRPALYDLRATKPDPLVPAERRYEVAERASPDGIEQSLDLDVDSLVDAFDPDTESVAISFMHAYAHPENEERLASQLRDETDLTVVASHETLPEFREYERTATTVADAYVTPVISAYLTELIESATAQELPEPAVMQSNGGIAPAARLSSHAVSSVLSGPAAGVVGASLFDEDDDRGVITFDMGGTSTDVGLLRDGEIEMTTEADVAGYPVHIPMVDVETVGAGGGSIAWVDEGGAVRVGPESAGANPGPICYGKGGEHPTVTDAALILGYLGADTTLGEGLELDVNAARAALGELAEAADLAGPRAAARGIYRVANATMTRAIRRVTLERGHDPRSFALVAFGGAGPMHATGLADRLDLETIRVPKANGVLSALGLLAADERHDTSRTIRQPLDECDPDRIDALYEELKARALGARDGATTNAEGGTTGQREPTVTRRADLRYEGQRYELTVDVPDEFDHRTVERRFHEVHDRRRGYRLADEALQLVTLRLTVTVTATTPTIEHDGTTDEPRTSRSVHFEGEPLETPVYDRDRLPAGITIDGPAIFEGGESTVVLPPAWAARVDDRGTLHLEVDA